MMAVKEKINIDDATVAGFGDEWSRFNQNGLSSEAREQIFEDYFQCYGKKNRARIGILDDK